MRLAERIAAGLAGLGVAALLLAVLVVIADIAARKSFGLSVRGTIDLTQLAQMACAFLALPYVFLRESHVSVDFFADRLPPRLRGAVRALAALVTLALMLALAWYSFAQAAIQVGQGDRSVTLGIPIAAYWAPVLAGMTLSCAAALLAALRHFGRRDSA